MLKLLSLCFYARACHLWPAMTLDQKVRFGIMAVSGAAVVANLMGVHLSPLEIIGGSGSN